MIPYILHVALLISVCLLFYKALLQRETFYRLNRLVLVFCLALSFALPLIPIPQQWAFRNSVKTEAPTAPEATPYIAPTPLPQTDEAKKQAIINATANVNATPVQAAKSPSIITVPQVPFLQQALKWLFYLYWIGVAAFGLNLLLQLIVLLYQAYTKPVIKDGKFRIIELTGDKAPCSFGNNIFINPEKYDWDTYSQILLHEKIHIQQGHSLDILIAEMVLVLQWFNPFAWLYRTELENNLEFLTDDSVLEHKEIERSSYQMSLLKVSAPHLSLGITTNYNQSLLKRRIVMMNAKKSSINTMWKYFFLVPLLGVLACALNNPAAYSKEAVTNTRTATINRPWGNNMRAEGSWFATIKGEEVKMEFRSDEDEHNWSSGSDFKLGEFSSLPKNQKGDFTLTREAGSILFNGKFDGNQGYGHYKFTASKEFKSFLSEHHITETGEGDDFAFFMINIKKGYVQMLERNGYTGLTKNELISMGALKVDEPYIQFWKANGYPHLTSNQLVSGKALGITAEYVSEIRKAGYTKLSFDQLVSFKATGINGKYISSLHGAHSKIKKPGDDDDTNTIPARQIISVKALNVKPDYISSIQKMGYANISIDDITSMKALGVTPEYIESLKAIGYNNIPAHQLTSMKAVGVTPEVVKGFEAEGYKNIPINQLISMKSLGITHDFIQSFKDAGYKNMSVNDLVSAKAMGITPQYAKSFEVVGYKNIPNHELNSLKALGVTPDYIKGFEDAGYKDIPLNTFSSLKAIGVTLDFIQGFKKLGFDDITLNEATSLKATGITPEYVTEMREKGFKSQDIHKYIQLKNAFN
jgi:hypothetical protein